MVHVSFRKPMRKCVMKVETRKNDACVNVIDGRKHFIGHIRKILRRNRFGQALGQQFWTQ